MKDFWPCHYGGLEPLNKRRWDWRLRYAAAFQLGPAHEETADRGGCSSAVENMRHRMTPREAALEALQGANLRGTVRRAWLRAMHQATTDAEQPSEQDLLQTLPLALDEAMQEGRVKPDDLVVLSGFGAGLAWGTALMRW